jgi:DNA-binding GntR family transcriptional regulator
MTLKDVRELCMVRMALERLAVALLIDQGAKETVIALQKLVTTMRAARKDRPQLDELDEMFHERICSASGNELLLHTWHGMRDRLRIAMRATNTSFPFSEGIVESHKRVVDAIACDDRTQAESAVEEHIREGMTQLEASIRAVEEPAGGYQSSLPPTEVLLQ